MTVAGTRVIVNRANANVVPLYAAARLKARGESTTMTTDTTRARPRVPNQKVAAMSTTTAPPKMSPWVRNSTSRSVPDAAPAPATMAELPY